MKYVDDIISNSLYTESFSRIPMFLYNEGDIEILLNRNPDYVYYTGIAGNKLLNGVGIINNNFDPIGPVNDIINPMIDGYRLTSYLILCVDKENNVVEKWVKNKYTHRIKELEEYVKILENKLKE